MESKKLATWLAGGASAAALALMLGSMALAQSNTEAKAATTKSTKIVTAVGTLTVTPFAAGACPGITCPGTDTCENETLTGTSKNFNRFGGFKGNSTFVVCETIDTTLVNLANGCAPSTGIGILSNSTNTVTFGLSGEDCTLPGATGLEAFNQVGAITASTDSAISTGGGSFDAWDSGTTLSGSFNLSANYSK